MLHLKELEKEQTKPKESIDETKNCFYKKINKIDKMLPRQKKKEA